MSNPITNHPDNLKALVSDLPISPDEPVMKTAFFNLLHPPDSF